MMLGTVAAALLVASASSPGSDPRLALLDAMSREGERAMERLRLAGFEAPFFVAYQLREALQHEVAGRFGAVIEDRSRHDRKVIVDVRVGSYALDSSGRDDVSMLFGPDGQTYFAGRDAPLDDDPRALRNTLWLLTDEKYKEALASYLRKRSKRVYRADEADAPPSLSRETPQRHVDRSTPLPFDAARWRGEVRRITALFRSHPALFDATMKVTADKQIRWLTTSEGTALVTEQVLYGVHVQAVTRATDGQLIENNRSYYARGEGGLPSPEKLEREVRTLILELEALRTAPVLDPYIGPAILAPEATGVLFHEAVGHRLEGERQDDEKDGQTFKGQIGRPILPGFLSVIDDPTMSALGDVALSGNYAFDDEGVPARRTVLVEDGTLRNFLLSRRPVYPFTRSNGHGRSQGSRPPVARMATLVVSSKRQVPMAELKRLLLDEARRQGKPYALIIQDVTGGDTNTMSYGYQAFKGTPRLVYRVDVATGKQELVRGVELVGTPLTSINKVIATGDEVRAFNGFCGAESGYVAVSTIAPAALVSEIELQRVARANERSPILPAPWDEDDGHQGLAGARR